MESEDNSIEHGSEAVGHIFIENLISCESEMLPWIHLTGGCHLIILDTHLGFLLNPLAVLFRQICHLLESFLILFVLVRELVNLETVCPVALVHGAKHPLLILIHS